MTDITITETGIKLGDETLTPEAAFGLAVRLIAASVPMLDHRAAPASTRSAAATTQVMVTAWLRATRDPEPQPEAEPRKGIGFA